MTTTPTSSPPSPSDDDPGPTTERSCSDVADRLSSSIGLAATDSKTTARLRSMREEGRAASVLVLVSSDLHVLLTLRSAKLNSHPSQVCFPGGRQDPSDGGDDVVTALRETKEEVGLDYTASWKPGGSGGGGDSGEVGETGLRIVCRMPSTEALGQLCVTPIVAVHTSKTWREIHSELIVNDDEVATAFWAPLGFVLDDEKGHNEYLRECHEVPDWPVPGASFVYRAYDYDSFPLVASPPRDVAMLLSGSSSSHLAKPVFAVTGLTANILLEVAGAAYGTTTARRDSAPGGVDVVRNASVSNFERKGNYGGDGEGEEEEEGDGDDGHGDDGPILRGLMLRRVDRDSANGGSSWVEGCFALTAATGGGGMIHHYDSVEDALRRRQSARKKNRLRLAANTRLDASLTAVDLVDDDGDPKTDRPSSEKFRFVFRISTLGGRLDWDLAASSPEERTLWMKRIESLVKAGRGSSARTAPPPPPPTVRF